MESLNDDQLRQLAKKRVEFRSHILTYFAVNAMLWVIWLISGRGYPWPIWPMAGWGIGVFFNYMSAYNSPGFLSEETEFKKLKKEMEEKNKSNP